MTDNMLKNITWIGFDADDTLWHNEIFYLKGEDAFKSLLTDTVQYDVLSKTFADIENRNMDLLGYGAKAMTISMIETAIHFKPDMAASQISRIIEICKEIMEMPVQMLPGAEKTVQMLEEKNYRIIIITKGELNEQMRKFRLSPLNQNLDYFVLPDKSVSAYQQLFRQEHIDPNSFLMIGNSPKSDILPPLELGCYAAYIPFETTWAHEDVPLPNHDRLIHLRQIESILDFL